jgi:hypothetical protein
MSQNLQFQLNSFLLFHSCQLATVFPQLTVRIRFSGIYIGWGGHGGGSVSGRECGQHGQVERELSRRRVHSNIWRIFGGLRKKPPTAIKNRQK